jgi:hypothetical protein
MSRRDKKKKGKPAPQTDNNDGNQRPANAGVAGIRDDSPLNQQKGDPSERKFSGVTRGTVEQETATLV